MVAPHGLATRIVSDCMEDSAGIARIGEPLRSKQPTTQRQRRYRCSKFQIHARQFAVSRSAGRGFVASRRAVAEKDLTPRRVALWPPGQTFVEGEVGR